MYGGSIEKHILFTLICHHRYPTNSQSPIPIDRTFPWMRKSRKHTYKHCSASKYFIKTPRYTCSGTAFTHEARLKSQKSRREFLTRCVQLTASGGAAPESTDFARHKSFPRCTRMDCLLLVRELSEFSHVIEWLRAVVVLLSGGSVAGNLRARCFEAACTCICHW